MFCIPQTIKYLFNDMFISFIGIKLPMCCITIKIDKQYIKQWLLNMWTSEKKENM